MTVVACYAALTAIFRPFFVGLDQTLGKPDASRKTVKKPRFFGVLHCCALPKVNEKCKWVYSECCQKLALAEVRQSFAGRFRRFSPAKSPLTSISPARGGFRPQGGRLTKCDCARWRRFSTNRRKCFSIRFKKSNRARARSITPVTVTANQSQGRDGGGGLRVCARA